MIHQSLSSRAVSTTETPPDIRVFHSLDELPDLRFPMRIEGACLVVCQKGSARAGVDVTIRNVGANDIIVLKPGHTLTSISTSDDFQGFLITATRRRLTELFPNIRFLPLFSVRFNENPVVSLTDEELRSLSMIHDLLRDHLASPSQAFHSLTLVSLCEVLFFKTLSIYASRTDLDSTNTRREELLNSFLKLLEDNFRQQRAVTFYADKLFVTPKHLSAVLKDVNGNTTRQWIDQRVIQEAKLLLRTTGLEIQEISSLLNFANQSFFGKYFKHLTGYSPRHYRNNLSSQ